jgi:multidrug efflux system membrane fusion protein
VGDSGEAVVAGKVVKQASISYLARQADPMTQGYRLEAEMVNNAQLRAGLSVQLDIKATAVNGHLVPASTILLNDLGQTVIRVLDNERVVKSYKVTVIGESAQGMWVAGLPEQVVLVTVGQNYIIEGEQVEPSFAVNSTVR